MINNKILNENYKFWLGGFREGEGSLLISIIKSIKAPYGIFLQPEFNVSQHINGLNILKSLKELFNNKGSILKKSGSANVWVYSLKGVKNINVYVIPFFLNYVTIYSSKYKNEEFNKFIFILKKLNEKPKCIKDEFRRLVQLTYNLNPSGKGKSRKRTLSEVFSIIDKIG